MKIRRYVMYLSILIALVTILWPSKYDRIMKPILEMKEKNLNLIFDGKPEPPFPDKKKNIESITGIDVNKNGIRDDLEIYANRVSKTELERKARLQFFYSLEELNRAFESRNIEKTRYASSYFEASTSCLYKVISKQKDFDFADEEFSNSLELFNSISKKSQLLHEVAVARKGEPANMLQLKDQVCGVE